MTIKVIAQFHPAASLHQPRLWAVMLDDWEHLPETVDASYTITKELPPAGTTISLDTETDGHGGIGQWSIAWRGTDGVLYVRPAYGVDKTFPMKQYTVIFHNAKYDIRELAKNGMPLPLPDKIIDTMIAAYCMGLGRQDVKDNAKERSGDQMVGGLGLKYLARRHLGMTMKTWQEVQDNPEVIPQYNAEDSVGTYLLFEKWKPVLPHHFWTIDRPLLPVIMKMEDRGILVDPGFLRKYAEGLDEKLAQFNLPLNPFAPEQLQSYVYGTLEIEPWRFTDTGAPSVDDEVLETIDDPVIRQVREYKQVYHDRNTYAKGFIAGIEVDSRLHTEFKQTSTATGRLSSARPNLQNIDKTGDMRSLFVAPEGKLLIDVDFNQLELRVLAAVTQDPAMLKALNEGRSLHQETATKLGLEYKEGKIVNFLTTYAGGAWKIAEEFHIPIDAAKAMQETYYESFPGVRKYHEQQKQTARTVKKVTNWFGRTRRLDSMFARDWRVRGEGEREAINTPIQGAAAEIVKLVMIALDLIDAPMILQVHDELLFEVDEKEARAYARMLKDFIPTVVEINGVRFPVEVKIGKNWQEMEVV